MYPAAFIVLQVMTTVVSASSFMVMVFSVVVALNIRIEFQFILEQHLDSLVRIP